MCRLFFVYVHSLWLAFEKCSFKTMNEWFEGRQTRLSKRLRCERKMFFIFWKLFAVSHFAGGYKILLCSFVGAPLSLMCRDYFFFSIFKNLHSQPVFSLFNISSCLQMSSRRIQLWASNAINFPDLNVQKFRSSNCAFVRIPARCTREYLAIWRGKLLKHSLLRR